MPHLRVPKFRFRLGTFMALFLGVAIGFSLNQRVLHRWFAPATETNMRSLPTYIIEPPDILQIKANTADGTPLDATGSLQVGPDGRVTLGSYGSLYVAGMTIAEATNAIERHFEKAEPDVQVVCDVAGYNSKKYYIVVEHPGKGNYVQALPITGNETVLDAISIIGGFRQLRDASTEIYVARPSYTGKETILPVDFDAITRGARTDTNYQLWPGDRLFIAVKPAPISTAPAAPTPAVEVTSFEEYEVPNYHIPVRKQLETLQATSETSAEAE